jgi:hypothetical protein
MSTSKFLKDKKKGELSELAELTNLPEYAPRYPDPKAWESSRNAHEPVANTCLL